MMLTPEQERLFRDHLRAVDARETCPVCDADLWRLDLGYAPFLTVIRICQRCAAVQLFDWKGLGWEEPPIKIDGKAVETAERGGVSAHFVGVSVDFIVDDQLVTNRILPSIVRAQHESLARTLRAGSALLPPTRRGLSGEYVAGESSPPAQPQTTGRDDSTGTEPEASESDQP